MGVSKPTRSEPSRPQQPRWFTIAFYVGLLLIVAWLAFSSRSGRARRSELPTNTPAPARDRVGRVEDRDATELGESSQQPKEVERRTPRVAGPSKTRQKPEAERKQDPDRDDGLLIRNLKIYDEDRRLVYEGDVDLAPTLKRIERGKRLRFSNDGSVFENRERRLPKKPSGYYHEFVQPTPGERGPGAQRIVIGDEGEVFYTPDHYRTFRRIR